MVSIIKELIELNLEALTMIPDAELLASLILNKQEEEGMLPPLSPGEYPIQTEMRDGRKVLYYPITKWEKE